VHYEGVVHTPELKDRISDVESRMYVKPLNIVAFLEVYPTLPFLVCEYLLVMGISLGVMQSYIDLLDMFPMYLGGFIWDFFDQALFVHYLITDHDVLRFG
ncbi:beta-galactosidase, partial [Lactobacillus sp. CRM56-2]|nr:beta-galactosidase [Lactobacillus sp. CRM56-2]